MTELFKPRLQGGTFHYVPALKNATASGGRIVSNVQLTGNNGDGTGHGGYNLINEPLSTTVTLTYAGSDTPTGLQLLVE